MGFYKRMMENDWDRGWSSGGDKWVCADHVEDSALEQLIADNATSTTCSYCNRTSEEPFAAELDLLIARIASGLKHEWGNADDEGVAWDGGYAGVTYDTYEVLTEMDDAPLNSSALIADVVRALPDQAWVQRDYYRLLPHRRLRLGWERFGEIVKHSQRYFFADHVPEGDEDDPDYMTPAEMLSEIGNAIRDARLLRTLPADSPVFRGRADKNGKNSQQPPRSAPRRLSI